MHRHRQRRGLPLNASAKPTGRDPKPKVTCTTSGCKRPSYARGFCKTHHARLVRGYQTDTPIRSHQQNVGRTCNVEGCVLPAHSRGFCKGHYQRAIQGIALDKPMRKLAPKGSGSYTDGYHYIIVHGHPNATARGVIGEHRYVMAQSLERALYPNENVHHKNGDRADNRLTKGHELHCSSGPSCCNLELWVKSQAIGQRAHDLIGWAEKLLAKYAPEKLAK